MNAFSPIIGGANFLNANGLPYGRGRRRLETAKLMIEVFFFIDRNPCVNLRDIADEFHSVCERTITRYLIALEELNLVESSVYNDSGRRYRVYETAKQLHCLNR